jgi:hypothetical protein
VNPPRLLIVSCVCLAAALAPDAVVRAQPVTQPPRFMAIGVMAGEPSGVTLRMMNPDRPVDAWEIGLGWSWAGENALDFHAQHQWHLIEIGNNPEGVTTLYLGAGGRVKDVNGTALGLRGALGINYVHPKSPRRWETYFEVAPILDLTPESHTWLSATAGMRWFLPQPRR